MSEKCICNGWEWGSFESYSTCPNCDFPANRLVWVKKLMTTADRRLELLREVEWAGLIPYEIPACPICWESQDDGHADDCRLAKEVLNND